MADIFISYRHDDSAGHTGRLVDGLKRHFGPEAIFLDAGSIESGNLWDEVISDAVNSCRVLLAVIGRNWLTATSNGNKRLDDPEDTLRREISTALKRNIRVVPVLVDGARMPFRDDLPEDLKPLARRHAHELRDLHWDHDTKLLFSVLDKALDKAKIRRFIRFIARKLPKLWFVTIPTVALLTAIVWWELIVPSQSSVFIKDRRTSTTQIEDQAIEIKAENRVREVLGERGHVNVTGYNRMLLITGEVPSEADREAVERAFAGINNLRSVVNELGVLSNSSSDSRSSDVKISNKIKASFSDARDLQANAFKVVTERGTVYLMGRVTEREAARATELARNIRGVEKVVRVFEILTEEELSALQSAR